MAACGLWIGAKKLWPTESRVTVKTPSGAVIGEEAGAVRIFRGVPFAQPPVGALRFRPPQAVKPWSTPREALQFSASAMQPGDSRGERGVPHSEDCLYLNIWAPAGKGPFPVYLWIHGGGFTGGHAFEPVYDGVALAKQGVVLVTVAYRLGVFGFLDLGPVLGPAYSASDNNALRDLMAALAWVRGNIAAFGGDPERVTIGGESAGAKLTGILMGVPSAQPLFRQMISESGGAERVHGPQEAAEVAEGFAAAWKQATGQAPAALATAPSAQLIEVQRTFMAQWPKHFPLRCQVDGKLLPRTPIETIRQGSSKGKRLLIGTNRDESALFLGPHPQKVVAANLGNVSETRFDEIYKRYAAVYPDLPQDVLRIRAVSAEEYWIPSMRVTDAHVEAGGEAYVYRLDFSEDSGGLKGYAYHSLDIPLVWRRPHAWDLAAETALGETLQRAWVVFLSGGAPAAPGLPAWPRYNPASRPTMILNNTSRVEKTPQDAELHLWDGVL